MAEASRFTRPLLAAFVVLAGGGCTQTSSFGGVDLDVSAPTLSSAQLTSLQYFLVSSSGADTNEYRMVAGGLTAANSQHLRYASSATSGAVAITVSAVDGGGHVLATGSGNATLKNGSAKVAIVLASSDGKTIGGDMGAAGPVVTPAAASVARNGSVSFSAPGSVTWSVVETAGGTIGSGGTYSAPAVPGLYHVLATDGSGAATRATVTVGFNRLQVLAGMAGGSGSVDGVGTAARFNLSGGDAGLVANAAGTHVYIADRGNATIRRLDVATDTVTTIAGVAGVGGADNSPSHPGDPPATFSSPWGLAVDAAEQHLYVSDFGSSTIRAIDLTMSPPRVTTIAGTAFQPGFADAAHGPDARFNAVLGLALDEKRGLLYVADYNNCRVRAVAISGGATTTLAGNGNNASVDSNPGPAQVANPIGVAIDDAAVYFAEAAGTVRKIVLSSSTLTTLAGTAGTFGNGDGTGSAALFGRPNGLGSIGTAASGALVLGDPNNGNVRLIMKATGVVTTLAGSTTTPPASGYADGTGSSARFNGASGIAIAGSDAYVVDTNNACIRRVASVLGSSHAVTTIAGWPTHSGSANGSGTQAQLNAPYGLVLGGTLASATAWVADFNNFRVRSVAFGSSGSGYTSTVATLAGSGTEGTADGKGTAATLGWTPSIVFDGTQTIYALDRDAGAIRTIDTTTGQVKTLMAKVPLPRAGALVDPTTLYVATDAGAIVKVTLPAGPVTTVWGAAGGGVMLDGSAAEARFNFPTGIVYDGVGALYVADTSANALRRIDLASGYVTTVVNVMGSSGDSDGDGVFAQLDAPFYLAMLPNGQVAIGDGGQVVRVYDPASREVGTLLGVVHASGVVSGAAPGGLNNPGGLAVFPTGELLVTSNAESVIQIAD